MSFALPSPQSCCTPCDEPTVVNTPGPQGPAGEDGTDGTDGVNAYTTNTAEFTMPAEGDTVTVDVGSSAWMVVGQKVAVGKEGSASFGTFEVSQLPDALHVVLTNVADAAAGEYSDNSVPGTVFPAGSKIGPSGLQGPGGESAAGGAPVGATYITQTPNGDLVNSQALSSLSDGVLEVAGGTGVLASRGLGVNNGQIAVNDGTLTDGDPVFATAAGVETVGAAAARTALGLGTMATQDGSNVTITGGTITGVSVPAPSGVVKDWLVFQNQQATGVSGGGWTQGSWVTVPLNTEVVDTGGHGSIAANQVTLAAGTYRARWAVPGYQVQNFQTRLWNVTTAAVVAYGSNAKSDSGDATSAVSRGWVRFTIGGASVFKLEGQCQLTNAGSGFGLANSFGATEVFGTLELEKET